MALGDHTLVTFGGNLGTSPAADKWQCGVRVVNGDAPGSPQVIDTAAYLNVMKTALQAWFTNATPALGQMHQLAHLDFIKVAQISRDTNSAGKPVWKYNDVAGTNLNPVIASPAVTGGAALQMPWICTAAVSWTTALQRGLGHTGRVYLPFAGATSGWYQANLTAATVTDVLTKGKGLLTALAQTGTFGNVKPVVMSLKSGAQIIITGVRVGNVVDVQRRRKEQIPETYTSSVWP